MKKIVVVSLFDGLSGARIVFDRIEHLEVVRYYSSEVDKYAIQVANHNYPQDEQYRLGDITKVDGKSLIEEIREEFGDIDVVLVGGSPCQGFSMAGKLKGSSTKCGKDVTTLEQYKVLKEMNFEFEGQSYLFWEYVRLQKEINPKYFMLENVRVTKKWLQMFNNAMGVEPTRINSSLVSAQNRDRYYWHNLGHIEQPNDDRKNLVIADILDENVICEQKIENSKCLVDTSVKPSVGKNIIDQHEDILNSDKDFYQMKCTSGFQDNKIGLKKTPCLRAGNSATYVLVRPCKPREYKENSVCHHATTATDIKGNESIKRVYAETGKAPTATTMQGGNREPKVLLNKICNVNPSGRGINGNIYGINAKSPTVTTNKGEGSKISQDQGITYRKLTPLECERLQTYHDNYTLVLDENGKQLVSNSQRYKMIGNGWTTDVPVHILKNIR